MNVDKPLVVDDNSSNLELAQEIQSKDVNSEIRKETSVNENMEKHPMSTTSNIVTMEPYVENESMNSKHEPQRRRRTKYRADPTLIHFDYLFGYDYWSRFLILKTASPITATKLENILLTECPS